MYLLKLCLMIGFSFLIAADKASGQDELSAIKAEIAELRKEIAVVRKERDTLRKELASMKGENSPKESQPPEGEINGIIWEISAFRPDNTLIETRKFLALDGKIYAANKEIGTYTENRFNATAVITGVEMPRYNGTYKFTRFANNPPTYSGRFTNNQGDNLVVRLRMVKD